jgi:hypothetical protein
MPLRRGGGSTKMFAAMIQVVDENAQQGDAGRKGYSRDGFAEFHRAYADEGYCIFRDVVPKELLARHGKNIVAEFDRAKRESTLFAGGGLISGHLNYYPGEDARPVHDALERRGIIDFVRAVLPGKAEARRAGGNLNLPKSGAQHYHVDGNFLEEFIIVNVAVVDTEIANGAIDVLPGTHKKFYKYWRFAVERAYRLSRRLPLKQGDVLVRSSNLWHRGMPNLTSAPRPMLGITYGENCGVTTDPFVLDGGKLSFQPNWFKPTRLGRLRERTFVTVPITYAAYRFVRSLYGNKGYGPDPVGNRG